MYTSVQLHAELYVRTRTNEKGVGFIRIYGDTPGFFFQCCGLVDGIWEHPYMAALLYVFKGGGCQKRKM